MSTPVSQTPPSAARQAVVDSDAGSITSDRISPPCSPPAGDGVTVHADLQCCGQGSATQEVLACADRPGTAAEEVPVAEQDGTSDDEWAPRAVLARKRYDGEPWLKVAWRQADPTWVLEEDFIDEGHKPLIDAFLQKPPRPPRVVVPTREPEFPFLDPADYWPDFKARVAGMFVEDGLVPVEVDNILDVDRSRLFLNTARERKLAPTMLMHGTASLSIPGVIREGLHVPGTQGVRVKNGSPLGLGIYTATSPEGALRYVRMCSQMVVCAGLVDPRSEAVLQSDDTVVFFDSALVIPVFLVGYTFPHSANRDDCWFAYRPRWQLPYRVWYDRHPNKPEETTTVPVEKKKASTVRGQYEIDAPRLPDAVQRHLPADRKHHKLSKRDLKAMPSWAKRAYREGMLGQKPSKK